MTSGPAPYKDESVTGGPRAVSRGATWTAALLLALAVALVSAFQIAAGDLLAGRDAAFRAVLARQILAALAWLPPAAGVVWIARRVPVRRTGWIPAVAIHAAGILGAAAAVNIAVPALWRVAGVWPADGGAVVELALRGFFGLLHVNALVYIVLAGAVHLLDRRRTPRPDPAPSREEPTHPAGSPVYLERLTVPDGRAVRVVEADVIRWIEAAGDYVRLHLPGGPRLLSERMWALERKLDPGRFMRVHRSAIVRLGAVREVRAMSSGDAIARLGDGEEVRVSRRLRRALLDRLAGSVPP